ncbi:MAG: HYR domain-containing protein [Lewinellaceae bacterium]|nr:HYR domain-containing protein [Lewinellaceae bacterium]
MSRSDLFHAHVATRPALLLAISCLFFFITKPVSGQCSLSCNSGLQVSLDPNGQAAITAALIAPSASANCPGALELKLLMPPGIVIPNNILTCDHVGLTITAQVTHTATGNSCAGTLQVYDALAPTLNCPDKFVFCNQDATPNTVGLPAMSDNCTPAAELNYSYFDNVTDLPCGTYQNGVPVNKRIDRNWMVSDAQGNSGTCQQKVWLKHITLAGITFPPNLDGITAPSLDCSQDPNDLILTGQPTVAGIPIDNSPDCEFGVTYNDQIINICPPAGYSVLRTWTAVDFCTGTLSSRLQIIKVEDKTPPQITVPGDLTVGTDGFLCSGTVTLPAAEVSDNCSDVTVTTSWTYGAGYGPFFGVGFGAHVVTYTAMDACGNTATATLSVHVEDSSPPQAICGTGLQVSLSTNGVGFVNAGTLDEGSFDNCGSVTLSISRDDITYAPAVEVNCADIGAPLTMYLKVTDDVGLENLCVTEINVRDFLKPTLICPAAVTLNCLQDHTDLQLAGQAAASDNCSLQGVDFEDFGTLSACNAGTLQRVWTAADAAGNTKSCVQQIVMETLSDISVAFAPDLTVSACSDPGQLTPAATGEPVASGQFCSALSITYTDETFDNVPAPYCYRIFRTWKVIDFCIYDPNDDSTGVWTDVQVISIVDNQAPVLSLPAGYTVDANSSECNAFVALDDAYALDCGNVTISHDSPFADQQGANASGTYPVGIQVVVFTATDDCGNSAQQTMTIEVLDAIPPVAVCKSDVFISLDTAGQATLSPSFLDGGSFDNCSPGGALEFTVSPAFFECKDTGNQQVMLMVLDQAGNVSSCSTIVNVIDPAGACQPPPPTEFSIEGNIRTPEGMPVTQIPLVLAGDGFWAMTESDSAGQYLFEDVPASNLYHLEPANNANWLNGISTYDVVLISKHILGLDTFETPYERIAADVNHSGTVTTFDIVQLRKLILGLIDTVPGNTSWRFVDTEYIFPDPSNPFGAAFPEKMTFNGLDSNLTGRNFTGIKIGDLNHSNNPAEARTLRDTAYLRMPDVDLVAGIPVAVPLYLDHWTQLEGLQFELMFDTALVSLKQVEFSKPDLLGSAHLAVNAGGVVTISWDHATGEDAREDDPLMISLQVIVKENVRVKNLFHLSASRLFPEVYPEGAAPAVLALASRDRANTAPSEMLDALSVYPNPFCDEMMFSFHLESDADLVLRVFDAGGREILHKVSGFSSGQCAWRLHNTELAGPGIYFYQLIAPGMAAKTGRFALMCPE